MSLETLDNNLLRRRVELDITEIIDSLRREFPDTNDVNRKSKRLYELIDRLSVLRENDYARNPDAQRIIEEKIEETQRKLKDSLEAQTDGIKKR